MRWVALALIACGCHGAAVATPARPTGFSAEFDAADYDHVLLKWDPVPTGTPQPAYYEVEAATVGYRFVPLVRVSGNATSTSIALTGSDDSLVRFRLGAYGGSDGSSGAMSEVLELYRGMRPPAINVADQGSSVLVSWTFRWIAFHVVVQRRIVTPAGAGEWEQVLAADMDIGSGMALPTQYEQRDLSAWRDGARFEFRVTGRTFYQETGTGIASSAPGKPFAPTDVTAAWDGSRVRVTWKYPGLAPLDFTIVRTQPAGSATADILSPANSFEEAATDPGVWHYEVTARVAGTSPLDARSRADTVATDVLVRDPRWEGVLASSLVRLPRADVAVRNAARRFGLLRRGFCCSFAVHAPDADGWMSWSGVWQHTTSTDPTRLSAAPLSFDGAGMLHVFYEVLGFDNPGSSFHIHHRTWSATTGWTDEEVARTWIGDSMPAISTVDVAGAAQLVWSNVFLSEPAFGWAVRNGNGAWVTEAITAGSSYVRAPLATDPGGQPAFVTSERSRSSPFSSPLLLVRRALTGMWSSVSLPEVSLSGNGGSDIVGVFAPTATRSVVVYASPAGAGGNDVWVREHDGTQWSGPELAIRTHPGRSFAAALSADGKRLAVAAGAGGAPVAAIRTSGTWSSIALAPSSAGVAAGPNQDGSLWILQGLDVGPELTYEGPAQDRATYVLYEL